MVLAIKCEVVGLIFSTKKNFLTKYNFAEETNFLVWLLVMRQRICFTFSMQCILLKRQTGIFSDERLVTTNFSR